MVWGVFFVLIYASFSLWTYYAHEERIFNSPDETANYFFAKQFSENSSAAFSEELNVQYQNVIHPRAVITSPDGKLLPGSFLGIIYIYGLLAKILGNWSIIFLTPLISLFAAFFFFKLLKEFFSSDISFLSSLLLFIFPGFWYYNSRSMFHNALFLDLVIFFLYFLATSDKKEHRFHIFFASFFLALAIFVRTSEALWLIPICFAILFLKRKTLGSQKCILAVINIFALIFLILVLQYDIFGNFLTGAYFKTENGNFFEQILKGFFPFGIHPITALINFIKYFVLIFWWFFIPGILGFFLFFITFSRQRETAKMYTIAYSIIFLYLVFYYGSWSISDNLDPKKITIGTSYVRYWLFLYAFGLPYVSYFFMSILQRIHNRALRSFLIFFLASSLLYFSYNMTWSKTEESLGSVYQRIQEYYFKRTFVSSAIPSDSIIATDRSDKIFFPKYRVIVNIKDEKTLSQIALMVQDGLSVYYYSHLNEEDIEKIQVFLLEKNLQLKDKTKVFQNEYLYMFKSVL